MRPLAIFIAHSGKTVELDVGPDARVEAVQATLADLTGVPAGEQILMCEGARLEPAKPLAAYGLPWEGDGRLHDVFLYSRAHLRPDAQLPPPEALPPCPLDLSGLDAIRAQRHRLDAAGSPLLRALPDYCRQFQEHLLTAGARHEASQQRMATAARLVSEQEVQALSIDAATANVEVHYAYICDAFGAFMGRYRQQAAAHTDVLSRFDADLAYLAATELHPALRREGCATLAHLVVAPALREAAAAAARGHHHFAAKVSELEALFGALKADVEALFMQAPSVDLEVLAHQLEDMHGQVEEQASIVAALSSDLAKVQAQVEQAGEALASDPAASVAVSDTAAMLETMHEMHVGHLLPRTGAAHAAVEAFATQCLDCKNALTRDVLGQLRTISSQQSKIREVKNKLALFREALARQDGAVQELLVVRRVPAAYKQCLAECVRRDAFMTKYAHSAAALAERMGAFRGKELAMRDAFRAHVERLIPAALLERMGLLEQPPHCQVSVSAAEGERLLAVTVEDVRRIQLPWGAGSASLLAPAPPPSAAAGSGSGSREAAARPPPGGAEQQQQQQDEAAAAAGAPEDAASSLQLENAKLRAELAAQIALDCIRSAQMAGVSAASFSASSAPPAPGLAGSGQASPPLGESGAAAAGAPAAAAALPPEAAQRFERALAAKDGLAAELQAQLAASRQQVAAYEGRIQALETQLTALAGAADGRAAQPLLAGSGLQPVRAAPAAAAAGPAGGSSSASSSAAASAAAAPSNGAPSGGVSSSAVAVGTAGTGLLLPEGSVPAAAAAGSSGTNSLASSPTARQAAPAPDLSASGHAATDSSFSGAMHAADPSRCLGHSSSLPGAQRPGIPREPRCDEPASPGRAPEAVGHPAAGEERLGTSATQQPLAAAAAEALLAGAAPAEAGPAAAADVLASAVAAPLLGSSLLEDPCPAAPPPTEQQQQQQQLQASMVVDEGSDVEGIEPVSDSDYASGGE